MKLTPLALLVLATSPVLAGVSISPARPEQLNSKHHLLRVQQDSPGEIAGPADDSVTRLAVGAKVTLVIPPRLGTGHGPFQTVYDEPATLAVKGGGALAVQHVVDDRVEVLCQRAGTFELAIDVAAKGKHVADTVEVGCIEPTRFTATNVHTAADPYLAGASELTVVFGWYGKLADGREVPLVGKRPVVLAPGETALAPRPAEIWHDAHVSLARARAVDAHGRAFAGLHECALTTYHGDVASEPETSCMARVVRGEDVRGTLPRSAWSADRVCFDVLGQRACKQVP